MRGCSFLQKSLQRFGCCWALSLTVCPSPRSHWMFKIGSKVSSKMKKGLEPRRKVERKAPNLNCFNFCFVIVGWECLKEDLLTEFHRRCKINREMNTTFLTLLPILSNSVELPNYKPISLVGYLYKSLAKILANYLKHILPLIIGHFQGINSWAYVWN